MNTQTKTFLELVNHYPSPHNGQPIRINFLDESNFELYFDTKRGLQATDISYIFSFVSMGVFIEHMSLCATALGHEFIYSTELPREEELRGKGAVRFAICQIDWNVRAADDTAVRVLQYRQTSRKKYYKGIPSPLATQVVEIAKEQNMTLKQLSKAQTKVGIWLNQRAVFDDMFDEPVRKELNHWLRYTKAQKLAKKDGLSYDCMELNGRLMKYSVDHPGILRAPGIAWLIKQYYIRKMMDSSDMFYMLAPFKTEAESFAVGKVVMAVWNLLSAQGYYLHPFGTIMSNHAAHKDFLELVGVDNESRENAYLVFIFRAGKSEKPIPSLRIPITEHLILE